MKGERLSTGLDWVGSACECFASRTMADPGLIVPENYFYDTAFFSAGVTKDDVVWNRLLRIRVRSVTGTLNRMASYCRRYARLGRRRTGRKYAHTYVNSDRSGPEGTSHSRL